MRAYCAVRVKFCLFPAQLILYISKIIHTTTAMKKITGFTLMEMMVAIAIVAILASLALPSYLFKIVREQIESALPLSEVAKRPVALAWAANQTFPADNADAGLPLPEKIVNNYVSAVAIQNGAIHLTFGNRANSALAGKVLSLRPAVVEDAPVVPVTWVCAGAEAPDKMTVKGENKTSIAQEHLPLACRRRSK